MTTTHNPKVERALADIEANKTGKPEVDDFLDFIGELIIKHGDAGPVLARVIALIEQEKAEATE
ncbi:hypothetical protein OH768_24790 [Streptomyces sp. NBC_01622]|uniref:hypothetical protein n=1 Tax=Streptomyces sp. NBC_01622 TaxID=2975903 RepID=UPI003868906C|nr:hypothetical protein OH768_24790 [Streptomyces sp. NBC_01622]